MKNFCYVVLVGCPQYAYSVYIKEVITQLVLCTKLDIFGSQWRSERTQTQREWTKPEPGFIQELNTKAVFSHACRCDLSQSLIKSRWISKWIRICSNHMHSSSRIIIRDSVAILIELLFGLARHYICATFVTFCNYLLVVFDKIPITGYFENLAHKRSVMGAVCNAIFVGNRCRIKNWQNVALFGLL